MKQDLLYGYHNKLTWNMVPSFFNALARDLRTSLETVLSLRTYEYNHKISSTRYICKVFTQLVSTTKTILHIVAKLGWQIKGAKVWTCYLLVAKKKSLPLRQPLLYNIQKCHTHITLGRKFRGDFLPIKVLTLTLDTKTFLGYLAKAGAQYRSHESNLFVLLHWKWKLLMTA